MQSKIALEEHFAIDLIIGDSQVYAWPEVWRGNACKLFNLP